jgi:Holliday junction resolvase RusA-like endonuclease
MRKTDLRTHDARGNRRVVGHDTGAGKTDSRSRFAKAGRASGGVARRSRKADGRPSALPLAPNEAAVRKRVPEGETGPPLCIEFDVEGCPRPAGSKRAFPIRRRNGSVGVVVTDTTGQEGKEWRSRVVDAAKAAHNIRGIPFPEGAIRVWLEFRIMPPKEAVRRLEKGKRVFPASRPDLTKLIRSVEDALTGILWRDDAQVISQVALKRYAMPDETPGVRVKVTQEGLL